MAQLNACSDELELCRDSLEACAVFPGDGVDGPMLSYTDNGDGTFTDKNTQLMWEMKDNAGGIHDVDNIYTWSSSGTEADGTLFTEFLNTLNNMCDGDETTACTSNAGCIGIGNELCGHAGFRDWRIPNIKELQSIVNYGASNPASSVPGRTAAPNYWSSTTVAVLPSNAWNVTFVDGFVVNVGKDFSLRVRAVRGGR